MTRKITCPGCRTDYALARELRAHRVTCRKCGTTIDVDDAAADQRSAAPAASASPVRRARTNRKEERFAATPFYLQPVFYVGLAASVVCGYFAMKFH